MLSPSTAQDDHGAKFLQYQTIGSLTDYLLVDSTAIGVLHYRRRETLWEPLLIEDAGGVLVLDTLGFKIQLAAIYLD